ncbi:MAG: oligosaccharide flippase family protein [Muribaculaceae bacterium]|nr:oligosaccharide flippase family protein [Muribaculaceae bacterium]
MNQIKAGAVLNYVIIGLNTLVGLAYTPYMLRCLGQNDYGLYSLVASVIAYLTILDFGFGNAIIRYTAKFRAEGKRQEQWEMFGMFLIVYSVIGLLALAGGFGLYFNVDALFDRTMTEADLAQARTMMLLLTLNLAFTFPLSIFGSIISAYENFVFQRLVNISRIILSTGVLILVLAIGYKAVALVVVQTVFNLLTLLINYVYCKKKLRIRIVFGKFDLAFIKEIAAYSFWIFLNAIMDKIYWGTGQFVLGALCGTVAVAVFSVAILLQQMYMTFSTSIVSVLLPRVTAMVAHSSTDKEISDLFIRTGRIQCLVISLVLCGFVVFGAPFIKFWAGADYAGAYIITLIFFATLFTPLIQNTGIVILQARNQMKFRSLLYLGISLASLGLQIVLARHYGALGSAIAIGLALLAGQGLIMNIYYHKCQHIDIGRFWREICRQLAAPALLTAVAAMAWNALGYNSAAAMILGIVIFAALFVVVIWKFSMNQSERRLVLSPLQSIAYRIRR